MRTTISWRADCGHCMLFENLIYSLLFTLATLYRRDTSYRNYRVNFYMQTMSTSTRLNLVTVARANPSQNECMYILKIELFMLIWIIYCCFQSFCINANTNTTARSDCIDYFYQHFYLIKAVSERERIWKKNTNQNWFSIWLKSPALDIFMWLDFHMILLCLRANSQFKRENEQKELNSTQSDWEVGLLLSEKLFSMKAIGKRTNTYSIRFLFFFSILLFS